MIAPNISSFLEDVRIPAAEYELPPAIDEPEPEPEPAPAQEPEQPKPKAEPAGPPIYDGEDLARNICEMATGGLQMLAGEKEGYEYTDDMVEKFGRSLAKFGASVDSPALGIFISVGIPTIIMGISAFQAGKQKRKARRVYRENRPEKQYENYEAAE